MHPREQTIFALSTGRLPSAIAIVRVSGPRAGAILRAISGKMPMPRRATRALLRDAKQQPIDDAVTLWFPGPASVTGEDVAELHVHGGRAVLAAVVAALSEFDEARAAEPGEFTRRAFENGKLDLTEAEGLDDLIHADTDRQRRQALRQLKGLLGHKARDWRNQLIEASALIEAGLDFSDEGDVPGELISPALAKVKALLGEIEDVLAAQGRSERLREGLVVAIAGPPNVGKSSLVNLLARRNVAIVSPYAGTTRDVIEVQLDLDGYPVTVVDTAGIRETMDPVEQEGVRRARARVSEADLVLWMSDPEHATEPDDSEAPVWRVRNKIDLVEQERRTATATPAGVFRPETRATGFDISASRGDGIGELLAGIVAFAQDALGSDEGALITRERQRTLLVDTAAALHRSIESMKKGEELAAEDLRSASFSLGRLLGGVDVEDILDVIFSQFCIGK
jgi:tRNA modification GTPase